MEQAVIEEFVQMVTRDLAEALRSTELTEEVYLALTTMINTEGPDLTELTKRVTMQPSKKNKAQRSPEVDPLLQLKWALSLLGEEKAKEYLGWI